MQNNNIKGIARDTLRFILATSKSSAPDEFAGVLRAEDGIIKDVLFVPGTESSHMGAVLRLHMLPNIKIAGTVHSHPGTNRRPSEADLQLFSHTGNYHIIAGYPYDENSWTCYDSHGQVRILPVLDVVFEEDENEMYK